MSGNVDFIVVGGGCMGASSVLAVIKARPDARVLWYTGTKAYTASNDFMKIIRDVYVDRLTSKYANRALQEWQTSPYQDYFHRTGWVRVISESKKTNMIKTADDIPLTTEKMVKLVGCTTNPTLDEDEKLYLNRSVGYADSARAVDAVSDMVAALGVTVLRKNVTGFLVEDGKCLGVQVEDTVAVAEHTIVSAGVWTPGLLKNSGISVPPGLFTVTAVGVATLPLTVEEFVKLEKMPILVTDTGEVMLSRQEKVLKITTNKTVRVGDPNQLPTPDIEANRQVLEKMLPQFRGRPLESFICPDLLTKDQNPVVDHVPGAQGLVVVAGGSYHSFKFLPILGNMVILRILGQEPSDPEEAALLRRWSWSRPEGGVSVHPNIVPQS